MSDPTHKEETESTSPDTPAIDGSVYNQCMTCGQCISRCFLTDGYPEMNPRKLVHGIASGKTESMSNSEFIWACTLCGRCTTDCPKGIEMDAVIRRLRGIASRRGKAPERLMVGIQKAFEVGNNTGIDSEEFADTVEWMLEELTDEVENPPEGGFVAPIDKEGAELLYVPNPREYTSNPTMFQTYIKFLNYMNVDWTMSSKIFDITNWPYYLGTHEDAVKLVRNLVEEARRLKVKTLLSTECGHGFKILRKDAEGWLGEPLGFDVISVVELAHRYLKEGKLSFAPHSIEGKVTYHDPCNVGRKLGVYEPPRELLQAVAADFVELTPNRKYGICCGGGGSVAQNTEMGSKRLEHAEAKRDQILASGASIVTSSCQNCMSQIQDLKDRYNMPVEIKSLIELVVEAMEAKKAQEEE